MDGERQGEMRKGRRERIEKGSRERIIERNEKETKRQFEEKEGLRDPVFIEFSTADPAMLPLFLQVLRVGAQASKLGFYKLIECIVKKNMSCCETECKNMCHW